MTLSKQKVKAFAINMMDIKCLKIQKGITIIQMAELIQC